MPFKVGDIIVLHKVWRDINHRRLVKIHQVLSKPMSTEVSGYMIIDLVLKGDSKFMGIKALVSEITHPTELEKLLYNAKYLI